MYSPFMWITLLVARLFFMRSVWKFSNTNWQRVGMKWHRVDGLCSLWVWMEWKDGKLYCRGIYHLLIKSFDVLLCSYRICRFAQLLTAVHEYIDLAEHVNNNWWEFFHWITSAQLNQVFLNQRYVCVRRFRCLVFMSFSFRYLCNQNCWSVCNCALHAMQWHFFLNLQTINACFCSTFLRFQPTCLQCYCLLLISKGAFCQCKHECSRFICYSVMFTLQIAPNFFRGSLWKQCLLEQIFAQWISGKNVFPSHALRLMKKMCLPSLLQPKSRVLSMFGHIALDMLKKGVKTWNWNEKSITKLLHAECRKEGVGMSVIAINWTTCT